MGKDVNLEGSWVRNEYIGTSAATARRQDDTEKRRLHSVYGLGKVASRFGTAVGKPTRRFAILVGRECGRDGWKRVSVLSARARDQKTPIGSSRSGSILPTADPTFSLGGAIRMILALTAVLLLTIPLAALLLMGRQGHPGSKCDHQ